MFREDVFYVIVTENAAVFKSPYYFESVFSGVSGISCGKSFKIALYPISGVERVLKRLKKKIATFSRIFGAKRTAIFCKGLDNFFNREGKC